MKQLEVQIMGQSYLLGCPEGGDGKLLDAVEKVDTAMCKIRDAGKVKARDRIAVLAALNLAFEVPEPAPGGPAVRHNTPTSEADTPTTAPSANPVEADPRLTQLIARLDQVLGEDGRLL